MIKILVVNNDIDTMSLLKRWLEKQSYLVKYTSSGEEVTQMVNDFSPDLILVDVLHKHILGKLKTDAGTLLIPIILMTGYTRPKIKELVVDDTIEKPFNLPLLERKIEMLVKKIA